MSKYLWKKSQCGLTVLVPANESSHGFTDTPWQTSVFCLELYCKLKQQPLAASCPHSAAHFSLTSTHRFIQMDDFYYSTANEQLVTQFLTSSTSNASMWPSTFYFRWRDELFHFFLFFWKSTLDKAEQWFTWKPCFPLHQPVSSFGGMSMTDTMSPTCAAEGQTVRVKSKRIQNHQEIKSSVWEVSPRRSTHRWPGPCSAWSRGRQRWPGRWWRPPLTPADGSPCCQSGKDVRQDRI